jgi:hypothetical protein
MLEVEAGPLPAGIPAALMHPRSQSKECLRLNITAQSRPRLALSRSLLEILYAITP